VHGDGGSICKQAAAGTGCSSGCSKGHASFHYVSFRADYRPRCAEKSHQRCKGGGCVPWQGSGMLGGCRASQAGSRSGAGKHRSSQWISKDAAVNSRGASPPEAPTSYRTSPRVTRLGTATVLTHLAVPQETIVLWKRGRWACAERKLPLLHSSGSQALFIYLFHIPHICEPISSLCKQHGKRAQLLPSPDGH